MKRADLPPSSGKKFNTSFFKKILVFLAACAVESGLYFYLVSLGETMGYVMILSYVAVFIGLIVFYVIYNRGNVGRVPLPEERSPDLPYDERLARYEKETARKKKSVWILIFALPLLLSILLDYIGVQEWYNKLWQLH